MMICGVVCFPPNTQISSGHVPLMQQIANISRVSEHVVGQDVTCNHSHKQMTWSIDIVAHHASSGGMLMVLLYDVVHCGVLAHAQLLGHD